MHRPNLVAPNHRYTCMVVDRPTCLLSQLSVARLLHEAGQATQKLVSFSYISRERLQDAFYTIKTKPKIQIQATNRAILASRWPDQAPTLWNT